SLFSRIRAISHCLSYFATEWQIRSTSTESHCADSTQQPFHRLRQPRIPRFVKEEFGYSSGEGRNPSTICWGMSLASTSLSDQGCVWKTPGNDAPMFVCRDANEGRSSVGIDFIDTERALSVWHRTKQSLPCDCCNTTTIWILCVISLMNF